MARIIIHVLNFHGLTSHIELLLEDVSENPSTYYRVDRWSDPRSHWGETAKIILEWASSIYSFEIEADPSQMIDEWRNYYCNTEETASVFGENCAVAVQHFLTHFANIPVPKKSTLSWNHVACGVIWWPNIIPCPVMLPGRVMDNVKYYTKNASAPLTSSINLAEQSDNRYVNEAIHHLNQKECSRDDTFKARIKINQLYKFYSLLSALKEKANHLRTTGHTDAAEIADRPVKNIQTCALEYLENTENSAFQTFKSQCFKHIHDAKPVLANHRGKIMHFIINLILALSEVDVFPVLIPSHNKTPKGKFTFFKNTKSIQKVNRLANELTKLEDIEKSRTLTPLRVSVT